MTKNPDKKFPSPAITETIDKWGADGRINATMRRLDSAVIRGCGVHVDQPKIGKELMEMIRNLATRQTLDGNTQKLAENVATFRNQCNQILAALGHAEEPGRFVQEDAWKTPQEPVLVEPEAGDMDDAYGEAYFATSSASPNVRFYLEDEIPRVMPTPPVEVVKPLRMFRDEPRSIQDLRRFLDRYRAPFEIDYDNVTDQVTAKGRNNVTASALDLAHLGTETFARMLTERMFTTQMFATSGEAIVT